MTVDVLAIGAHPDDVEICCGGTLVQMARAGRRVGILHLTSGEAGTRGTTDERRKEAGRAAEILGAHELEFLALGDGSMRTGPEEEDQVIEVLRRLRPELVLGPATVDRHPDHERAYCVVAAACFYAGLVRRGSGTPHRPAALFTYMQNDSFEPSFVVDVTSAWETKMRALDAYGTQIHPGAGAGNPADGPVTKISSRETRLMIDGRARHYGDQIGAEFGEPYLSRLPLAVADPWQLLPRGIR
jgi:N-acetylglucosamine malate deacetylase 1